MEDTWLVPERVLMSTTGNIKVIHMPAKLMCLLLLNPTRTSTLKMYQWLSHSLVWYSTCYGFQDTKPIRLSGDKGRLEYVSMTDHRWFTTIYLTLVLWCFHVMYMRIAMSLYLILIHTISLQPQLMYNIHFLIKELYSP